MRIMTCFIFFFLFNNGLFAAKKYQINFDHQVSTDYQGRFLVVFTSRQQMSIKAGEKSLQDQKIHIKLKALIKYQVLEVNHKHQVTKASSIIEKIVISSNGQALKLVKKGDKLEAQLLNGKKMLTLNGKAAPKDLKEALQSLCSISAGGTLSDQESIGAGRPVAVGETWTKSKQARQVLKELGGIDVKEEDLQCHAKLKSVGELKGQAFYEVAVKVLAKNFQIPLPAPGAKIISSKLTVSEIQHISQKNAETLKTNNETNMQMSAEMPHPQAGVLKMSMTKYMQIKSTKL